MSSLFFAARNKKLAKAISIKSPNAYRESIEKVKNLKGISAQTKVRALALAKARASVQLKRNDLSEKEREQFSAIRKIPLNIKMVKEKKR